MNKRVVEVVYYVAIAATVIAALAQGASSNTALIAGGVVALAGGWVIHRRTPPTSGPIAPVAAGPRPRDWALVVVNVTFCLISLLMFASDWRVALSTLAIFGGCGAWAIANLRRKLRERRFAQGAKAVTVVGGVELRPRYVRGLLVAAAIIIGGLVVALVNPNERLLLRICGAITAFGGGLLLFRVLTGLHAVAAIRFDPEGLTIAKRRYRVLIPWDEIIDLAVFEFAGNAFAGIDLRLSDRLAVQPIESAGDFAKDVIKARAQFKHDVAMMTGPFGFDVPMLVSAIQRYVTERASRAELGRRAVGT